MKALTFKIVICAAALGLLSMTATAGPPAAPPKAPPSGEQKARLSAFRRSD
jgi:hypothetical protein